MKLDCDVVKDLFVLYKENELSSKVQEALEAHLKGCNRCAQIYHDEEGFNDIELEKQEEQPSSKLDEKIMLRLKVTRLKIAVLFVAALFIVSSYFSYYNARVHLGRDLSTAEHTAFRMGFDLEAIKNKGVPLEELSRNLLRLNEHNILIARNLNIIEQRQLKDGKEGLFLDRVLLDFADVLKKRYDADVWTDRDEKAYNLMKHYMEEYVVLMTKERDKFNLLHDKWNLKPLLGLTNIPEVTDIYDKMNQLSLIYSKYNMFPDEIELIPQESIKVRIIELWGQDNITIRFPELQNEYAIRRMGDYSFEIWSNHNQRLVDGRIDAYTGAIRSLGMGPSFVQLEGELLSKEEIEARMMKFLSRAYKGEINFVTEYMGINYRYRSDSDVKLYSFHITPMHKGYKIMAPLLIHYDARSGLLNMLLSDGDVLLDIYINGVNTEVKLAPHEALMALEVENKETWRYEDTAIIKSVLSGEYTLVHTYSLEHHIFYINTSTGKQEFAY